MAPTPSADSRVNALLTNWTWSGAISWSAPAAASVYGTGYPADFDGDGLSAPNDGFRRLTNAQVVAARFALDADGGSPARAGFSVEGFTNLPIANAGAGSGDIRVAVTADTTTGFAFFPGGGAGGDVWIGQAVAAPRPGNYAHMTMLHEIGHAVGLKHTHEVSGPWGALDPAWDSPEFTVMTYRPWAGGAVGVYRYEAWGAPQTYMMLDIAALQQMYGADYTVNAGNTHYRWTPGSGQTIVNGQVGIDPGANRIFATIWDGGGRDTYDLSAYTTGVTVDLRPGSGSVFSGAQLADLGGGPNSGHARANIFNALQVGADGRSLIENAIGGSGADRLIGNAAGNSLVGNAGPDKLMGLGGADVLIGGRGADTFIFRSTSDSPYGAGDRIVGVDGLPAFDGPGPAYGDLIDLRGIDADTVTPGNQSFIFGYSGRGGLWLQEAGVTNIFGNTDDDAAIELHIQIVDGAVRARDYSVDDFLL